MTFLFHCHVVSLLVRRLVVSSSSCSVFFPFCDLEVNFFFAVCIPVKSNVLIFCMYLSLSVVPRVFMSCWLYGLCFRDND